VPFWRVSEPKKQSNALFRPGLPQFDAKPTQISCDTFSSRHARLRSFSIGRGHHVDHELEASPIFAKSMPGRRESIERVRPIENDRSRRDGVEKVSQEI